MLCWQRHCLNCELTTESAAWQAALSDGHFPSSWSWRAFENKDFLWLTLYKVRYGKTSTLSRGVKHKGSDPLAGIIWPVGLGILEQGLPLKFRVWSSTGDACQQWGVSNSCINPCDSFTWLASPPSLLLLLLLSCLVPHPVARAVWYPKHKRMLWWPDGSGTRQLTMVLNPLVREDKKGFICFLTRICFDSPCLSPTASRRKNSTQVLIQLSASSGANG